MPITEQHSQELLSVAYAYAVAAKARMNISHYFYDYGIDLTFSYVQTPANGKCRPTGYDLKFQLKSSVNVELEDSHLVYDLQVETYNTLRTWEGPSPCYLLLMRLPREFIERLVVTEELMALRDCAYWHSIPVGQESQNTTSERIRIPRQNQFTAEALVDLMNRVKIGVHA